MCFVKITLEFCHKYILMVTFKFMPRSIVLTTATYEYTCMFYMCVQRFATGFVYEAHFPWLHRMLVFKVIARGFEGKVTT